MFYFTRPEATQAIRDAIGDREFDRVLVVGRIGVIGREYVLAYAHARVWRSGSSSTFSGISSQLPRRDGRQTADMNTFSEC